MITRHGLAALLCIAAAPVLAQAPAQTGTGGGPTSTIYAPNTTATGTTKPPGGGAAPDPNKIDTSRERKETDKIMKGICIGCGAK